jgi:hypothetical protein
LTQNKSGINQADRANAMYFPDDSEHVTVNNSYTYHNRLNNKSMINNKFGGAAIQSNQTRYVNKVNKFYQDGTIQQNTFRSGFTD